MRLDIDLTKSEMAVIIAALAIKAEHHEWIVKKGSAVPGTHRDIAAVARVLRHRFQRMLDYDPA